MTTRTYRFAARLCALGFGISLASTSAIAQQAGDNVVNLGWFHIAPQDSSKPMTTSVTQEGLTPALVPSNFTSPGSGAKVSNADTLGLVVTHFFTDNIALQTVAGVPAKFKLTGQGVIAPPSIAGALTSIDLGVAQNNPIVQSVRQWSPALVLQYYFGQANSSLRPFLGVGVSYTFFTNVSLNPNFEAALNQNFGSVLALTSGHNGPTSVEAKSSASWQPVFNAGLSYAFDKHWVASASVSYLPLKTTANIKIKAQDGTVLSSSDAEIKLNPIVTFVSLGYKF
ncbi:membrane protein [Pandoraea horticolens]|uniref:Membrane protein n=1 Tax=Pandoraea horticolens TaxID=2508298 RepID=A0A5E4W621_9BURK|nr:OmpW family outer membrane protein [Pandoraea horticolens]VVE19044.1 membrane protein [Pandoraea horticolens]